MIALALLLLGAQPPIELLRGRLLQGDLSGVERGLADRADRGEAVWLGAAGLLLDLVRFGRCQTLGAIPEDEAPRYRVLRSVVRLERVRLERRRRGEAHAGTWLDGLADQTHAPSDAAPPTDGFIEWPEERERWTSEAPRVRPDRSHCSDPLPPSSPNASELRRNAEERLLAELTRDGAGLPPIALARLAEAHLASGATLSVDHARALEILRGAEPERAAGALLTLAIRAEAAGRPAVAASAYRAALAIPTRTPDEDSRARARLVGLLEPDYAEILSLVRGASAPRAVDRPELDYAEARAIYGLGALAELSSFGRRFVRGLGRPDPAGLDLATLDLLYGYAVTLPPEEALGFALELGPAAETGLRAERLAAKARGAGSYELAVRIYDRLRAERRSLSDRARLLGLRAEVELERQDPRAFAALVAELVAVRAPERRAVVRAVADLSTRVATRLADLGPAARAYVDAILAAIDELGAMEGRYGPLLESHRATLLAIRDKAPASAGRKAPVVVVGEIVVPRLTARLRSADVPTPTPVIPGFLVTEAPSGEAVVGWPWAGGF